MISDQTCMPSQSRVFASPAGKAPHPEAGEIETNYLVKRLGYHGRIGKISNQGLPVFTAAFKRWLWALQGGRCGYCASQLTPGRGGQIDHIIPRSAGGGHLPPNVMYSCEACNAGKCNKGLDEVRWMIRIRQSDIAGVISPRQARQLDELGIDLRLAPPVRFLFEVEAWSHVAAPEGVLQ